MHVLVTGSTGLVGSAMVEHFAGAGHELTRLVRVPQGGREREVLWYPSEGHIEAEGLEGIDAVIHLAGENVASARWTKGKKRRIRDSRIRGTQLLANTFAKMQHPPSLLVSASAIGYYGDRGDEILEEDSGPGEGFLAGICKEWEAEALRARTPKTRVVTLRLGMVLSGIGGPLSVMLPAFRFGLGGRVGTGKQYMSWVALEDLVSIVQFCVDNQTLQGAVNALSPNPVTNQEFTRALGKILRKPTPIPIPRVGVNLLFGQMGRDLLLASARAHPKKLLDAGFQFQYPRIEDALDTALQS